MWESARTLDEKGLGPMIVFAEHRYYGKSLMNNSLHYLQHEEALADFVNLIGYLKTEFNVSKKSALISFGGSYGGMLTAWAKMKYPTVFDGAIAGSAPILAFDGDAKETAREAGN